MSAAEAAHLLVVDDDARLRVLLQRFLSEQGFRVTAASDAAGVIRFVYEEVGGEDSLIRMSAYYDETGQRRFIFAQAGAVNESSAERRWYFSASGGLIERRDKLVKGPGYPWDWESVDKILVNGRLKDPKQAAAFPLCPNLEEAPHP